MSGFYSLGLVLAKVEATFGTDPTPTVAANAIGTLEPPAITPIGGTQVPFDIVRTGFGRYRSIIADGNAGLSFSVPLSMSGTAGTAPPWGPLIEACGMKATNTASTSQKYEPQSKSSATYKSVTIWVYQGLELWKFNGCRGTWTLSYNRASFPMLNFTFMANSLDPAAGTIPSVDTSADLDDWDAVEAVDDDNNNVLTLDSTAIRVHELTIDYGNNLDHRNLPNVKETIITDRNVSGSMTIESPALGTKNFYEKARANTRMAFVLKHGSAAGKFCQIDLPNLQIEQTSIAPTDLNNILGESFSFTANLEDGDDECEILCT